MKTAILLFLAISSSAFASVTTTTYECKSDKGRSVTLEIITQKVEGGTDTTYKINGKEAGESEEGFHDLKSSLPSSQIETMDNSISVWMENCK
jgi:hypothetical protein